MRRFRSTREGKVWLGTAIGVGIAAVNTGNNLLYLVLGLMLSILLLSGALSDVVLFRIVLRRRLPRRVFAGVPTIVEIELENAKPYFTAYSIEIEDLATDEDPEYPDGGRSRMRRAFFLRVGPRATEVVGYRRVFPRRGRVKLFRLLANSRYPFGLIEKTHRFKVEDEVLVYPRRVPVDAREVLRGLQGDHLPTERHGAGQDTLGLREYREGDDARLVHWRRSAARDVLIVRETAQEAHRMLSIRIDQREPALSDEDLERWKLGLEQAISEAGSLAELVHGQGVAVEVQVRGGASPLVVPGEPFDPVWRFLAELESAPLEHDRTPENESDDVVAGDRAFPHPRGELYVVRVTLPEGVDSMSIEKSVGEAA